MSTPHRPRIVVADPLPEAALAVLRALGDLDVCAERLPEEALAARVRDADALIVRSESKVTAKVLAAAPALKVVARAGVGVDNIDVEAATRHGVLVINSPDGNTISAAEHTLALMLGLARHLAPAHASTTAGQWRRKEFTGTELYGKTLGIIGLGKIGREVAARAKSFQMDLVGYDPFVTPEQGRSLGVDMTNLEDLLARSDIVTLHLPLTKKTVNLIGGKEMALMKPSALLINCARGGLVDEAALAEALAAKRLAGAALDTFTKEPPAESPLLTLPNVLLTPHLGASTREAQKRVAMDVAAQVANVLHGRPARSPVNLPSLPPEVQVRGVITPQNRPETLPLS